MKIVFIGAGRSNILEDSNLVNEKDLILLTLNNWDDYGTKTTFPAKVYIGGERLEFNWHIKILIQGSDYSGKTLLDLLAAGWDGVFPPPLPEGAQYVSLPSDIDVYRTLKAKIGLPRTISVARLLRDASYLTHYEENTTLSHIVNSSPFQHSLLRESGANKAFQDGWREFDTEPKSEILDFNLNAPMNGRAVPIPFRFESSLLPYDINVLIGPNGIGKSYTLQILVEYWLQIGRGDKILIEKENIKPFSKRPNIRKLILVSYSPFEEFPLDLSDSNLQDKSAYKYFGFRSNVHDVESGKDRIKISRTLPAVDSIKSLVKTLDDDIKFGFMPNWVNKFKTVYDVLQTAVDFDGFAFAISTENNEFVENCLYEYPENFVKDGNSLLFLINKFSFKLIEQGFIVENIISSDGVLFLKNGKKVPLSSGQRLFSYIVINIVGELRDNSLIVVDEPELFLHPTLEITFISLLKKVLKAFGSKAILATHSLTTVREVPSNCVHVMRRLSSEVDVIRPPFETFGGDMQRISSYVFGDKSVSKPFDIWIEEKMGEYGDADSLIEEMGLEINEEMIMKILSYGSQRGRELKKTI